MKALMLLTSVLVAASAAVSLDLSANNKSTKVKLGSPIELRLEGNPTTGYSWKLDSITGKSIKLDGDVQYVAGDHPEGFVGAGGTFIARFKTLSPGKGIIRMIYVRPWEKGKEPAQRYVTTVIVTK
jgi:inhibitor of cysteine peptidase